LSRLSKTDNEATFAVTLRKSESTWRRTGRIASEKLLGDGAHGRLRRWHWSEVVAAREQRKPTGKLLTHRGDAILTTGRDFRYRAHCEKAENIMFSTGPTQCCVQTLQRGAGMHARKGMLQGARVCLGISTKWASLLSGVEFSFKQQQRYIGGFLTMRSLCRGISLCLWYREMVPCGVENEHV